MDENKETQLQTQAVIKRTVKCVSKGPNVLKVAAVMKQLSLFFVYILDGSNYHLTH